jgi:sortase A
VAVVVAGVLNSQFIVAGVTKVTYKPPARSEVVDNDKKLAETPPPDPNAPSKLAINSIGIEAPVLYDQATVNEANFQKALRNGVVHYPNTAVPGQPGNVVIFGHSSGQAWAPGSYKFIFTHLQDMLDGQNIFLDYQGTRYVYQVTSKKVVPPTDISVLDPTAENTLTLITCTPVGTSKNRLIITAKQIAPVPSAPQSDTAAHPSTEIHQLPTTVNPSFWSAVRDLF